MERFIGKRVVVTGSGSGFGEAIAKRFAREGASVIVADIDAERADRVVAEIVAADGKARAVRTDVSSAEAVHAMIELAVSTFGGLDVLINNAGLGVPQSAGRAPDTRSACPSVRRPRSRRSSRRPSHASTQTGTGRT